MVQGVIFDMDGLMFDSEPIWGSSWAPVCAEFGLEHKVNDQMIAGVRGRAGETMLAALREYLGEDAPIEQIWENEKALVHKRIRDEGVPKKPGLDDLLEYLHDFAVPMAVASGSTQDAIRTNLSKSGIDSYFDVLLSGESLGKGKPDPLIFLETAKLLGTQPRRTMVIEDSFNGVEAGARGGFITIMVPDLAQPTERIRSLATHVVDRLDKIIDLMESGVVR